MKRLATAHLTRIVMTIVIGVFLTSQMVVAQAEGIIATAWSPDGSMIAVSGVDGLLQIRDTSNQVIRGFTGLTTNVSSVDWGPDSTKIVSGGDDRLIYVWEVNTGQQIGKLTGTGSIIQVDWSPDGGKILATLYGGPYTLMSWNATSYTQIGALDAGDTFGANWNSDSTKIAAVNSVGYINIFSATLGAPLTSFTVDGGPISIAWSPDGTKLVTGIGSLDNNTNKILIWDSSTGALLNSFVGHTDIISVVSFSPNGQQIASASADGTVRIWNIATGQQIDSFAKPQSLSTSIAWSPDGTKLAYGGNDGTLQIVSVADVLSATPTPTTTPTGQYLISVLKPAGCTTTCFIGIQPGVTTQSEVKAIFASRNIQYTVDTGINNDEPNGIYSWNMPTTVLNFSANDGTPVFAFITFSKGIVRQVVVGLSIPVKTIVAAFGQPDAFKTDDSAYYMFYPQQGVIFQPLTPPQNYSYATAFFLVDTTLMNEWLSDTSISPALTCPEGSDLCSVKTATPVATITPMGIQ